MKLYLLKTSFYRNSIPLFILLLFIISACSSGKKALQKGNYYEATLQSVERLRQSPNNKKARHTLGEAYYRAVEENLRITRTTETTTTTLNWEKIAESYGRINEMGNEIRKSPAALQVVKNPKSYLGEEIKAKDKAAEARYGEGVKAMTLNNREDAKRAYLHFVKADEWVKNYKDVSTQIKKSKEAATLKVLVQPIQVPNSFSLERDFVQNQVMEYLNTNRRMNEFVVFYLSWETPNYCCADQFLLMSFDEFTVGQVFQKEKSTTAIDSVRRSVRLDDGSSKTITDAVKADYTHHEQYVVSNGVLDVRVIDAKTNRILMQDKYPGEFVWRNEWGTYQGDKRALDDDQENAIKVRPVSPPPSQDLFVELFKPIYDQLTGNMRRFYKKY
ncbi:hypothetical protein Fleli_2173 [Bernardetia litoralis DSM 6794]|uniref:Lipoprotein n=1 Tax=Bernardetia litoralis (strain ATCC 23117 / DSM 6794 / NBRC 15988 / NCIMB 1366 / Fx l1 / Sio-4) TaxID=880071 RepID=I4AKR8_BERLS|nr:hypothetical protein [Bernardetia litoralis]AFM04553.1 hypothetical protein Fleli_2173 [Bernardetia litoralis DSM 6794]